MYIIGLIIMQIIINSALNAVNTLKAQNILSTNWQWPENSSTVEVIYRYTIRVIILSGLCIDMLHLLRYPLLVLSSETKILSFFCNTMSSLPGTRPTWASPFSGELWLGSHRNLEFTCLPVCPPYNPIVIQIKFGFRRTCWRVICLCFIWQLLVVPLKTFVQQRKGKTQGRWARPRGTWRKIPETCHSPAQAY